MVAELPAGLQCPCASPTGASHLQGAGCLLATETLRCGALHTSLALAAIPLCVLVGASLCKCWSCDVLRLCLPEESQTAREGTSVGVVLLPCCFKQPGVGAQEPQEACGPTLISEPVLHT